VGCGVGGGGGAETKDGRVDSFQCPMASVVDIWGEARSYVKLVIW